MSDIEALQAKRGALLLEREGTAAALRAAAFAARSPACDVDAGQRVVELREAVIGLEQRIREVEGDIAKQRESA